MASLSHVNAGQGYVYQDARDVNTMGAATIMTQFFPLDAAMRCYFTEWARFLKEGKFFETKADKDEDRRYAASGAARLGRIAATGAVISNI